MKKNRFTKLIALALCVTMAIQIPVQAGAIPSVTEQVTAQAEDNSVSTPAIEEQDEEEEAVILFEDEEKREESVKHFRMSDGSFLAAQYEYPVHYEDESGAWQDYDNTLNLTSDILDQSDTVSEEEAPAEQESQDKPSSEAPSHSEDQDVLEALTAEKAPATEDPASEQTEQESSSMDEADEAQTASVQSQEPAEEYKNTASDLDIRLSKKADKQKILK
ncbi:MAG: hypothetical protein HFG81_10085, partial [Dorea sp.]|nr:hypothetical protein [Dorea sp.]